MFPWLASGLLWAQLGARGLRVSTVTVTVRDTCIPIEHSRPVGKQTCFLVNFPSPFLIQAQEVREFAGSHRPRVGFRSAPNNDLLRSPTPSAHVCPVGSKSAVGIRHNQITGPREVSGMTPASAVPLVGEPLPLRFAVFINSFDGRLPVVGLRRCNSNSGSTGLLCSLE